MNTQTTRKYILFFGLFIAFALGSCEKEKNGLDTPNSPTPVMEYFEFNNREIRAGIPGFSIDLNRDARIDLVFSTLLVGDPLNQVDKLQFLVQSNIKVNLPVKVGEEIPVMNKGDLIALTNFQGYQWFELSSIVLVQKIISFNQAPIWEGHWKLAANKYIPFQIIVSDKIYGGWIEMSVNTANEKLIVHRAAISKDANKVVKAGF